MAATTDFNGDGKADLLWWNPTNGQTGIYLMSGPVITSRQGVHTVADLNWKVGGVGDFDGDRKADILWQHAVTGQNVMYLMNGSVIASSTLVNTVADPNWKVVGVGDFDGDGMADILWRHARTGQNGIYLMNGPVITSSIRINTIADRNWEVVGVGDFNGDGKADILWRHAVTGRNGIYLMNGPVIVSSQGINTLADLNWKVAGVEEFNGDGKADILWRHTLTGQNMMYLMNGPVIISSEGINTVADRNWQIVPYILPAALVGPPAHAVVDPCLTDGFQRIADAITAPAATSWASPDDLKNRIQQELAKVRPQIPANCLDQEAGLKDLLDRWSDGRFIVKSVVDLGAKGDGQADDSAAINETFRQVRANAGGGVVIFPANKVFRIDATIGSPSFLPEDRFKNLFVLGYGAQILIHWDPSADHTDNSPEGNFPAMRLSGSDLGVAGLAFRWQVPYDEVSSPAIHKEAADSLYLGWLPKKTETCDPQKPGCALMEKFTAEHLLVKDCVFDSSWWSGIGAGWSRGVIISKNEVSHTRATGIWPRNSVSDILVTDNMVHDTHDDAIFVSNGIYLPALKHVAILRNTTSRTGGKGAGVGGVHDVIIKDNHFSTSAAADVAVECGVHRLWSPEGTHDVVIQDNLIEDPGANFGPDRSSKTPGYPAAIQIMDTHCELTVSQFQEDQERMKQNLPFKYTGVGVQGVTIAGNRIMGNVKSPGSWSRGIAVASVNRLSIHHNLIENTQTGIAIGCADPAKCQPYVQNYQIENNQVVSTDGDGILLAYSTGADVSNNEIEGYGKKGGGNFRGIRILAASDCRVQYNTVLNTFRDGVLIQIYPAANCDLFGNSPQ